MNIQDIFFVEKEDSFINHEKLRRTKTYTSRTIKRAQTKKNYKKTKISELKSSYYSERHKNKNNLLNEILKSNISKLKKINNSKLNNSNDNNPQTKFGTELSQG